MCFRAKASLNLEGQIKKVDGLVSGFETSLSHDGAIPDVPNAIKSHGADIQVRRSSTSLWVKGHQMGVGGHLFKLLANVDMSRPSNARWQLPKAT